MNKLLLKAIAVIATILVTAPDINAQWTVVGTPNFTAGAAFISKIALDSSDVPYLAFQDVGNSSKATVMKFDSASSTWLTVGAAAFSSTYISDFSFALDKYGVPYFAYKGSIDEDYKISIMKFDGTNWVFLGQPKFSTDRAEFISLAISPDNIPYVVYREMLTPPVNPTVMKFDGTNWVLAGTLSHAYTATNYCSLKFNPITGMPYVAFDEDCLKLDANSWVRVSPDRYSDELNKYISLAFAPNGDPCIAYAARIISTESTEYLSVLKYNGTTWENIGPQGISSDNGSAISITLAFNPVNKMPYVSYAENNYVFVKKFDGNNWVSLGDTSFQSSYSPSPSMAISKKGEVYLAFPDKTGNFKATVLKYSEPMINTGIIENKKSNVSLYPNPANNNTVINNVQEGSVISVTDILGKEVYHSVAQNKQIILNTSGFVNGVYILQVTSNGATTTKKLLVSK